MRTTVDLPPDLHRQVSAIARDTSRTFSQVVVRLVERGLGTAIEGASNFEVSARSGLPAVRLGRIVTTEDVRSLEDEENRPDDHVDARP